PHLAGVDAVVNAAGLFRQTRTARFADVHVRGPCALFTACAKAGVARVVQISALGADEAARSAYHLSKKEADDFLLRLPLASAAVAQPSLVYG
ncbi:NAD(P)H-binding protein, partial [Escherichia coli]|nr:NAD(P)H-binding protein [Escherichia coli]